MKTMNVFLDLDATVIWSGLLQKEEDEEFYDIELHKKKARKFRFENMDGYYVIFERPGLQDFLKFLFNNFNVSVWTAADQMYAMFIIDKFILNNHPSRKINYAFFNYHVNKAFDIKSGQKDLQLIWDIYKIPGYNKNNTFIIDDNTLVFETQPDNCIIAPQFTFTDGNSENDTFLINLQNKLEKMKKNKMLTVKEINDGFHN
jgi:TFIIF-interacting CTD phosphatase-like protein